MMRFISSAACSRCCVSSPSESQDSEPVIWVELTDGMKDMPMLGTCSTVTASSATAASSTSGLKRSAPRSRRT